MGIYCELNLFRSPDEYYQPGQTVAGVLKYSIDEPTEVERITTSLKGIGTIVLTVNPGSQHSSTYKSVQVFVDTDAFIQNEMVTLAVGTYEFKFSFNLPQILPSSMRFSRYFRGYKVKCGIKYYVRIKFERPGLFAFNKRFRRKINVISGVVPSLPIAPVSYQHSKKLMALFSSKDSLVKIKVTISNSVLPFSGLVNLHYEVENNTHVTIKSISIKIIEAYIFKARGHRKITYEGDVPGTEIKTLPIKSADTQISSVIINIPNHLYNIENAWIVHRHHLVRIIAQLPLPYRNVVFNIPIQIGVFNENVNQSSLEGATAAMSYDDPPPSYWEAMGETKKEDLYDSD